MTTAETRTRVRETVGCKTCHAKANEYCKANRGQGAEYTDGYVHAAREAAYFRLVSPVDTDAQIVKDAERIEKALKPATAKKAFVVKYRQQHNVHFSLLAVTSQNRIDFTDSQIAEINGVIEAAKLTATMVIETALAKYNLNVRWAD